MVISNEEVCGNNTEEVLSVVVEKAISEAIRLCLTREQNMYVYLAAGFVGIYEQLVLDTTYYSLLYVADPIIERVGGV